MKNMRKTAILTTCILLMGYGMTGCSGSSAVTAIGGSTGEFAAATENGALYVWGYIGNFGEEFDNISKPKKILKEDIVAINCGFDFGGALDADGTLYMWGDNSKGQLGRDSSGGEGGVYDEGIDTIDAIAVMENVVSFSCVNNRIAAVTEEGALYQWGSGTDAPVLLMNGIVSVHSEGAYWGSSNRFLAISGDGGLYSWGQEKSYSVLGLGYSEDIEEVPQRILDDVVSVALGADHSAAITSDGSLYTWGENDRGQLGNGRGGTDIRSYYPEKIMDDVVAVSLGGEHGAAVTSDGSLYTWGSNCYGELGNDQAGGSINEFDSENESVVPVKIMDDVASVQLFNRVTAAITTDGTLYMWGNNKHGQLGNGLCGGGSFGYSEGIDSAVPIEVMKNVAQVYLGVINTAAITEDGKLYVWGDNDSGQIGNGKTGGIVTKPTRVKLS